MRSQLLAEEVMRKVNVLPIIVAVPSQADLHNEGEIGNSGRGIARTKCTIR